MGLVSKLWHSLKKATSTPGNETKFTNKDSSALVQQALLLVGRANNTITYHRQISAMAGVMKNQCKING